MFVIVIEIVEVKFIEKREREREIGIFYVVILYCVPFALYS